MVGANILIVEDECVVSLDIKRTLERLGYIVDAVVTSGEAAVQQAAKVQPDLVLMDIRLSGAMDGIEAAEQIRDRVDTPVVYLTAYADDATLQRAKVSEPFGYLLKPFEERVLHSTIEMALFKHKTETRLKESEEKYRQLYAVNQHRLEELTALNKISHAVNSSLDLQETLTLITDHATRLLGMDASSVTLCDKARKDLWFAAASGAGAEFVRGKRLARGQGIVGQVVEDGEPALVPDVSQDPRFFDSFDEKSGLTTRSILCAPLRIQGRTIGAIEAISHEGVALDQEDLALLTSLAAPAATAIENARLHAETENRAEQLAILHELDRAITASLCITDVYQSLACHTGRLLSYDHLSITMIEGDRVRVAYMTDQYNDALLAGATLSLQTSSVGWVAARGQPLLRHSIAGDGRFPGDKNLLVDGIESVIFIPLQVHARVIGTCNIGSRQVGAYGPDELAIAQLMADQLAVAIENARLFEAEKSARRTAETLRSANLAFTQTLDLDVVLAALLDFLGQFVSYDRAQVMLVDENSRLAVRAVRGYEGCPDAEPCSPTSGGHASQITESALSSHESLLIQDTQESSGCEHHSASQQTRSLLKVPLVANGQFIGLCSLEKRQAGSFTEEHQRMAESLITQAAIAVQNARLYQQVRVGRERLQTLSRRLVEVQESERCHIARELHDRAGQALSSLMVDLRLLEEVANDDTDVAARILDLKRTVDSVSASLHQLATDLRPASLDHLGMGAALRQLAERFSFQHDLMVQFEMVGLEDQRLSPSVETAIFRIVQEALTNVVRHAEATRADVLLERQGDRVITIVEDDGVGFDLTVAMQSGRLGLVGVQERAEMLGGSFVVESSPGAGTTLFVEVPYAHSFTDC